MRFVARSLRAGIFLIVPAIWIVHIFGRGPAESTAPPKPATVELKDVTYNALVDAVKAQRGKVVVVDTWATFCPPCMAGYPHLLKLQEEFRSQGLVCMSLSVDRENAKPKALKFLQDKNSTIANYWMAEKDEVWAERWGTNGPPVIFIFDRAGRRAGKFTSLGEMDLADIDKLVKELLAGKP
jgi:thiol-disulfide isomerase/thioredoxin